MNMVMTSFPLSTIRKRRHCVIWLLMLTLVCFIIVSECKQPIQLSGLVGEEVEFRCPVDQQKKIHLLYLQKGDSFVNGFYEFGDTSQHKPWPGTRMVGNVVFMSPLNISHAGDYKCHIKYSDSKPFEENIKLTVTANYSKPTVHYHNKEGCTKSENCQVTCASYGGFPESKMKWDVVDPPEHGMWRIVNNTEDKDIYSLLYNVSSTASFNCSIMKPTNMSCSLSGVTSVFTVCEPEKPSVAVNVAVCTVIIFVIIVIAISVICLWKKCKRRGNSIRIDTHNVL